MRTAELYDPATGLFARTGSLTAPRGGATATLLRDGRVLVAGGDDGKRSLWSADLYDPRPVASCVPGRWPCGARPTRRRCSATEGAHDGRKRAGSSPALG